METKTTWLIANWKMHGTHHAVRDYAFHMNAALGDALPHVRVVFCPPAIYLDAARQALPQNAQLQLGAQDCHTAPDGAFTGEMSAPMLADCGARCVILGHSERRQACGDTDALVAEKVKAARAAGLTPIVCIGESLAEYEAKETAEILKRQLRFLGEEGSRILVAYEPIWAIGSGKTPSLAEIDAAHGVIKSTLGSETCVLYGGSVKPENIAEILSLTSVSGALIGGASLRQTDMRAMIKAAAAVIPAKAGIQP